MKRHELEQVLRKMQKIKGLRLDVRQSGDTICHVWYKELLIGRTKFSHGKIKDRDVRSIAKQLCFKEDELKPYGKCDITNGEYLEILRAKGRITE